MGCLRSHAICLSEIFLLVTVDLGKCDLVRAGQLPRQRVVDGGDGFAWSAPVGVDYISIRSVSQHSLALFCYE